MLLTSALTIAGAATPATDPALPTGMKDYDDDMPAASSAQAAPVAAWIKKYAGLTCDPSEIQAPGFLSTPLPALTAIQEFTRPFVDGAKDPKAPVTVRTAQDRSGTGGTVGILIVTPKTGTGSGVMLLLPGKPGKNQMTILSCAGTGSVKLRPSAAALFK